MKNYRLFMDVSGDVMRETAEAANVQLLPMQFIIDGEAHTYTDRDEGIQPHEFYSFVKQRMHISTTQITPTIYEEFFDEVLKGGESALYLCLSSGLSSTYESCCLAAKTLKEKYPDVDLVPIDSLQATIGMGLLCERMIENREKGLTIEQNRDDVLAMRNRIYTTGVVDDLDTLKRGGRISPAVAVIGGLLNFKPIIVINPDGTLKMRTTTHGMKKALRHFVEIFEELRDPAYNVLYIMHTDEEQNVEKLYQMLSEQYPDLQIRKHFMSPIIGAHMGSGSVGIAFYKKADAE